MPISCIDRFVSELKMRGLKPAIWRHHGKRRVYFRFPNMDREVKCHFDYETPEDQEAARQLYDSSLPATHCTVWHHDPIVRNYAREPLAKLCL